MVALVPGLASAQTHGTGANADTTENSATQSSEASEGLQEVTVTARRVSENVQRVPISVSVVTAAEMESRGVTSVYDLQFSSPSLTVNNTQGGGRLGGRYEIRGQGAAADDAPPGVVTYLNEVPVYTYTVSRNLFDMQEIEVLKGPQGTLFGRNTNGGAVLFDTKKPTQEFGGYVTARYGNLSENMFEAVVNLPVTDTLAVRIGGNRVRRDGFTKNLSGHDLDNQDYENARASVLWQPVAAFENLFVFNYTNINEYGPGNVLSQVIPCAQGGLADCFFPGAGGIQAAYNEVSGGTRTVDTNTPSFQQVSTRSYSNTSTLTINPDLIVKNIFGFNTAKFDGLNNFTNTSILVLPVYYSQLSKQTTDELQLQANFFEERLKVVTGAFYLTSIGDPFQSQGSPSGATNDALIAYPFLFGSANYSHYRDESRALFAQAGFKVTETLTLNAGYRYTWDKTGLSGSQIQTFFPGNADGVPVAPGTTVQACSLDLVNPPGPGISINPATCNRVANASFGAGNHLVGLDWQISPNTLLYITHRKGFKSGGFNSTSALVAGNFIYGPEDLQDVELGIKTQFDVAGIPMRFNASGFYDWYKDLQLTTLVNLPSGPQSLTQSVGGARLWGGESELTVIPFTGVSLGASLGLFDGKFTKGIAIASNGTPVDLVGVPYSSEPKVTYSFDGSYTHSVPFGGSITGSAFYSWRKGYYADFERIDANFIPSYGIVSARLALENIAEKGFDVALYGRNLADKSYPLAIITGGAFGFRSRYYGDPRTYGVEATYHFGAR
jgi:iron complex outermembrane receptor protein